RAEHGVDQRVRDDVAVGMAGEAARMLEPHAAEHERHAVGERVCVDADPDPVLVHASAAGSSWRPPIGTAPGGGSWRCPQGPRRMWTAVIPAASAGSTSLSTRSPTYAISSGGRPHSDTR